MESARQAKKDKTEESFHSSAKMAESQSSTTSGINKKPHVFRVRNLPAYVDRLSTIKLLCESINDITMQGIQISSLAYNMDINHDYGPRLLL